MRVPVRVQPFADRRMLQLQWTDPVTGLRRTRSARTDDPEVAEKRRADLEYELSHGLHADTPRTSWEDFRDAFEAEYFPGVRKNTRACYKRAFELFERLARPGRLDAITARMVSAFTAALRSMPEPIRGGAEGYKASTIATHLEYLQAALAWAVEMELMATVPAFPSVKGAARNPQPVPAELYERLLLACADDAPMHAYLQCGWLAGLRRNEAFYLSWEEAEDRPWLDIGRRKIIFPAAAVKGARDQWVPCAAELLAELLELPRHGERVFRFEDETGQAVQPDAMSARIAQLAARAKVRLTMRSLRRGFGCRYASRVPAQVLQKLMRHADIKTTMAFYANVDTAVEEAVFGPGCNSFSNSALGNPSKQRE